MVRKTDSNGKGITTTSPWTMSNSMFQNTLHGRHSITEASLCTTIQGGLESFFYITGCARAGAFPSLPLPVPLSISAVAPLSGIIIAYRPTRYWRLLLAEDQGRPHTLVTRERPFPRTWMDTNRFQQVVVMVDHWNKCEEKNMANYFLKSNVTYQPLPQLNSINGDIKWYTHIRIVAM